MLKPHEYINILSKILEILELKNNFQLFSTFITSSTLKNLISFSISKFLYIHLRSFPSHPFGIFKILDEGTLKIYVVLKNLTNVHFFLGFFLGEK